MLSDMNKTLIVCAALSLASLAAAQGTTDTSTVTTTTSQLAPAPLIQPGLTSDQYYQRAQELAVQAEIAYPQAFVDRTLWKQSVANATAASQGEAGNRDYKSYQAQLYTKTQWWINAYQAWSQLGNLTDAEKDLASLSAAKLAYLALQGGDRETARTYVTQGMQWKDTQSLEDIMKRL